MTKILLTSCPIILYWISDIVIWNWPEIGAMSLSLEEGYYVSKCVSSCSTLIKLNTKLYYTCWIIDKMPQHCDVFLRCNVKFWGRERQFDNNFNHNRCWFPGLQWCRNLRPIHAGAWKNIYGCWSLNIYINLTRCSIVHDKGTRTRTRKRCTQQNIAESFML